MFDTPKVGFVISAYFTETPHRQRTCLALLASLKAQIYPHWEAVIVHDGPFAEESLLPELLCFLRNSSPTNQVRFLETPERKGYWGYPYRYWGLQQLSEDIEYVNFTCDDAYYCPVYLDYMTKQLARNFSDLAYCSMVHNHRGYRGFLSAQPRRGRVDIGSFLVRKSLALETPFPTVTDFASDWYYFQELLKKARNPVRVDRVLYVHN